ncbi:RsbRD N-terminal domain-containing protein [Desulfoluna butyratoxydans]|uniref:Rsbt co-antagonist protein rsbrd n-terminal domain n=1 Tax=Desulfoluna butyratoxydans TaxID=231438 RepID=A0A4U8YKI3_9BACT|nr:RsbRD N-terminal domain-containing protein [Desulfoluna butyratoxydans]VFQ43609.1 rsbt co-antagonist protein rsbrd n-terminal domain [Desulfoluna butyratoxydans]
MGIYKHLDSHAKEIISAWTARFAGNYSSDGSRFIMKEKDPFNNPIGAMAKEGFTDVFALVAAKNEPDPEVLRQKLDPLIRLRAVQAFVPSEGVAFIFALKTVVKEALKKEIKEGKVTQKDLDGFYNRVDRLSLAAFDIYMACREQIYRLRASEVRTRTLNILKNKDILCEVPEVGTEILPHDVYKNGGFEKSDEEPDRGL